RRVGQRSGGAGDRPLLGDRRRAGGVAGGSRLPPVADERFGGDVLRAVRRPRRGGAGGGGAAAARLVELGRRRSPRVRRLDFTRLAAPPITSRAWGVAKW